MNTRFAFEEALNFMCQPCTSEQALGFNMSEKTRERLQYLMEGRRQNALTACEYAELEAYREVALYVHMRQIQARKNAH